MATGKQGFVRATEPQHSVSVQREKEMHVQAPLPAMYIQAVSGLPSYPQTQPPGVQDAAVIPLSMPMMYANQTLPFLTLHIASGAGLQQQRPEPPASSPRPKSAGKHVCPHCGRDCLKPSVLEKHLRCHTGERPYPCSTCGISFKTQSNLYKHKRTQAHARLSSESGKGTFSSQESTDSSRENCSSPSLELQNEDSGDTNRNDGVLPTVATSTGSSEAFKTGSETEWALCKAAVLGVIASPAHGQQVISHTISQRMSQLSSDAAPIQARSPNGDGRAPLTPNRTPLQRQEALFPKSQSHDSTDSGFSENNEQHSTSSSGATVHDSSMELDEPETSEKLSDMGTDDMKSKVSLQEKQELEKHILKLISENNVVMDDKHLVNVRPRKTVLSKQGSIDLPMPYTYKDSFHFEIRSSKHQASQKQDRNGRAFYSSMPTQHSTSLEHAPLTRSSSLPFSVDIQNSESAVSSYQADNVPLSRRCSAGHIYPFKSVDQHTPSHRSLVRQVAVDGLSAVEGSLMERGSLSSLCSDGDCTDTASESAIKRGRRKKEKKFAFNKWYMYGDGTFKKICNIEKDSVLKNRKSTLSPEQTDSQGIQISQQKDNNSSASVSVSYSSCSAPSLSPVTNVLTAQTSNQVLSSFVLVQNTPIKQSTVQPQPSLTKQTFQAQDLSTVNAIKVPEEKDRAPETQLSTPIPSERKKQKTDEHLSALVENTEVVIRMQQCESRQLNANLCQSLESECGDVPQKSSLSPLQRDNGLSLNRQGSFTNLSSSSNQRQLLFKRHSSPLFAANMTGTSASPSASSNISSVSQAKTSFLPKYQLKIPVLTDGMSDPCLGKGSSLNPSSPRQNVSLTQHPATTSPSTPQNQSTMTVMSPGQDQGTLCITAITKATSMTSAMYSCQNANAYTSTYTSTTSVSLATPLAFTDLSGTVSKAQSSVSPVSHSSTSTKNSQAYAGNVASVQDNPVTSVVIPTQSPGVTPAPVLLSSTDGIPLEISSTEIQGSQDTFYMQTADLQIVMQLISDEQLALIEPQIETQDYKTTGSPCFLSKDPETSGIDTTRTDVSQEIHRQCSGDTGTKLAVEQGNVNRSVLSNIPDITLMSFESTVTDHKAKSVQDVYLTNTGATGVISRSPSKHDVIALVDSRALGQQCKLLNSAPEDSMLPKEPETVGCGVSDRSYLKQKTSEKLSTPSADKSTAKIESEVSKSSAHDQILRKHPTSIIRSIQSCQDTTGSHGTIHTIVASNHNNTATCSGDKSVKVKVASFPEISERSPNHQPAQRTVQQPKSLLITKSVEKQTAETNTSCISVAPLVQGSTQEELIQPKSCQTSASAISSRSVLACQLSPQQPLNQTGVCTGNRSKYEENQTSSSGQSGQPLARQGWSKTEEVKAITSRTAHMTSVQNDSHGPVSNCLKEENMKCALGPGGMLHGNQDSFTGPPVSCSLRSLKFQREAETGRQKWIPMEPKSGGGDGTERVGTWDTKSTWTKQEEDAVENKREEANCTESYHIAVKPHPDLSASQHMTNIHAASPELVSISNTSSVCGITNPSHENKCLTSKDRVRENSPRTNVAPKQIDQSNTKVKEHVPLGCCERFTSLSRGPGDVRHLLTHPLSVNTIQKDVQKETQTKNSARRLTHSKSSQAQRPFPERETDGTARISVLNEPCMTSHCNTEHCQIIKTTPTYTPPSCSNQTNSSCIHPNPTCTSSIHSNPTELNAPHIYTEEEERFSSSDDEGKLIIELE